METEVTKRTKDSGVAEQTADQEVDITAQPVEEERLPPPGGKYPDNNGSGSGNGNGKNQILEPADITKLTPGRHYELSVNDGEVQKYQVSFVNRNTGQLTLVRDNGKKGQSHKINVNVDKCKVLRYKSQSTILREKQEEEKQEMKKALESSDTPKSSPEEEAMDETVVTLLKMISGGIRNIWMVGPAGCGKSTIAGLVAEQLKVGLHVMSCGIGTSSTEFIGYKYPEREKTPFSDYYVKPSIIVLDEFTALDPSVAQIANAALANEKLYTTTGLINRDDDCVIIATSNTFGTGGDMSYVANNQLDASTIDRFIGGIVEVNYSEEYESQFDETIVGYVHTLRTIIRDNSFQRIASTRMIINGEKLMKSGLNWRKLLVSNWTEEEQQLLIE